MLNAGFHVTSDDGPQFMNHEFHDFAKKWDITNFTTSSMHQQANDKAESAVKVMKTLLQKCEVERQILMKQFLKKGTHQDKIPVIVQRKTCLVEKCVA